MSSVPLNLPGGSHDPAELARLASEFFALLPNGTRNPNWSAPETSLADIDAAPIASYDLPAGMLGASPPPSVGSADVAQSGQTAGLAQGVPQAYAAALPVVDASPQGAPVPTTPYYFVGESSGYPSAIPPGAGLPDAQSYNLPGDNDLHGLLAADEPALRSGGISAARATEAYESARKKVARFLGAGSSEEIIFVRGTTEAINLIAKSWGAKNIGEGDEIIVSHLEHHANIVPWQQLATEKSAKLRVIPVDDSGQVLLGEYTRLLNSRTKLVAVTQVSNALGTVVPVKEIVELAHRAGALALVDGAQSVSHMRVDVQALDANFFVFSGHKVFAPTGIGVVYGKRAVLEDMPPWQGGGNMIADVTFERSVFQPPPARFEAGTGNIADAVGLGAAIDYIERIGMENIARYEHDLPEYATHGLQVIPGVRLIGTAREKASVLSFVLDGYQTEEVGKALNEEGIAVRSGHHYAQPILRRFGLEATVRPSLTFYNTCEEVDRRVAVVARLAAQRRTPRH